MAEDVSHDAVSMQSAWVDDVAAQRKMQKITWWKKRWKSCRYLHSVPRGICLLLWLAKPLVIGFKH